MTFDSKTKILTLAPFKYQSGQCDITLRDYLPAKDSVASKMTLTVTFVEHPYKFSSRILLDTVSPGNRHVVKLDSLDLDRKELEYVFGAGWPAWAAVDGRSIVLNPPMDAVDFYATLMVRKKVGAGRLPALRRTRWISRKPSRRSARCVAGRWVDSDWTSPANPGN